ncbi:hypothetical protein SAMD00019534_064270, partial [Acytostelium subglobosum LB1]|uniref:hypothetical protein n=1 Tax=Acytostelium subglobosum LB1 TaxID=1410327 RepID=UPI0006450491
MGKWTAQSYETELISKLRQIIEDINERKNKDGDTHYTFEEFVENLDVKSKNTRHFIEDLLRETCGSRRSRGGEYYGIPLNFQTTTSTSGQSSSSSSTSSSGQSSSSSSRGHQWYPNRYLITQSQLPRTYLQMQQLQQQQQLLPTQPQTQAQTQAQSQSLAQPLTQTQTHIPTTLHQHILQHQQAQEALNRASVNTDRITSELNNRVQNLHSTMASTLSSFNSMTQGTSSSSAALPSSQSTGIIASTIPASNSSSSSSANFTLSAVPQLSSSSSPSYAPDSPSIMYTYPFHQEGTEPSFIPVSPPLSSSTRHIRYIPITSGRAFSNVSLINSPPSSPPQSSHISLQSTQLISSPSNSIN